MDRAVLGLVVAGGFVLFGGGVTALLQLRWAGCTQGLWAGWAGVRLGASVC